MAERSTPGQTIGNPFLSRFMRQRQAGPFSFVIFGATGDLTKRKLIPALFNLYKDGFLAEPFCILGFARRDWTDAHFQAEMQEAIRKYSRRQPDSEEQLLQFVANIGYVQGKFEDQSAYRVLAERCRKTAQERMVPENSLFYMATPPDAFDDIVTNLNEAGLVSPTAEGEKWRRIVVEKPFGHDLESAKELNRIVHKVFAEPQVYRIDHYLGKETVQNILVFRLGNSIFEPLWNRRYVDNVQISVAESLGVESRAGYFESAGIIRDMIQSHIMQVFTLIGMEPPATFDATAIRDEKAKVLRSLRSIDPNEVGHHVVRAQYIAGSVGGERVAGYLKEPGVAPGSLTDTYVALRMFIDNWRWSGVPFYLRAGKRLPKRATEVIITFKAPPHQIFDQAGVNLAHPNILRLRIQPNEGISLSIGVKVPGQAVRVSPVRMDFMYDSSFGTPTPEAYERLLLDALTGDGTLFAREDEVELSWQMIDRITEYWHNLPLHTYEAGEWGPTAADDLLARDGHTWHRL